MQGTLTIRVYSRILDCGKEEARLWHVLRALDSQGRGAVSIRPSRIAALMGVGVSTVYRWLTAGMGVFWRGRRKVGGVTQIHLAGIESVAGALGLEDGLGGITECGPSDLSRPAAKALSTQLEVQLKQRQAYYAACHGKSRQQRRKISRPWSRTSSVNLAGGTGRDGAQRYLRIRTGETIPAASQASIAKASGWSQRTINRRLSTRWREERNITPVSRAQLLHEVTEPRLLEQLRAHADLKLSGYHSSYVVLPNAAGCDRVYRILPVGSGFFWSGCAVYSEQWASLGCRSLRSRVRRTVKQVGPKD